MKVKRGKHTYEVLKNGKPLAGKNAEMEAFLALMPRWAKFVAVAQFPASFGQAFRGQLRALTLSADGTYVDTVIAAVEKKWPKSVMGNGTMRTKRQLRRQAVRTRLAKQALGCRGPG